MKKLNYIVLLIALLSLISCDNYLDIEPVGKVIPKSVVDYRNFITTAYATPKNNYTLSTYRADELHINKDNVGVENYKDIYIWNDTDPSPLTDEFSYVNFYKVIFHTNEIINNAENISGNQNEINQLVGEAYALRALQYFQLTNLYAKSYDASTAKTDKGVPIVLEYDFEKDFTKNTVQEAYDLIIEDLEHAEQLINIEQQEIGYNYRFSKLAVKSLKARVFLYQKEWQKAIDMAEKALAIKSNLLDLNNNDSKALPSEYNTVESILALDFVSSFDIASNAKASNALINNYNQTDDLRFSLYFKKDADGRYNVKKDANNKYRCTFRTSELYLILAEAYTNLNKLNDAKNEIETLAKTRYTTSGLNNYISTLNSLDKNSLLNEIYKERQREFAIEGHRWFDLKRTTQPNIEKVYDGQTYTLSEKDKRYVIAFPKDAKINNPNL